MSHRQLKEVVGSFHKLFLTFRDHYLKTNRTVSSQAFIEPRNKLLETWMERMIEFRTRTPPPDNVFDIQYEQLVKDPIGTVHRIDDQFPSLHWSPEFETAMRAWLVENPQGKQGRHTYSLSEFGLEGIEQKELYKKYEKLFLSK